MPANADLPLMSVYTVIEDAELRAFLGHYCVGELTDFKGIKDGIENTNYFVNTVKNNQPLHFVLTIFEQHTFDELQYFLNLMHHLADHRVPSANPVADNEGNYLRLFNNKPIALVERLPGSSITETCVDHCAQLGAAMGKMHAAGLSYPTHIDNPRGPLWCQQTAAQVMHRLTAEDQAILQQEVVFQKDKRDASLPRGMVHADLFRDNALWYNDQGKAMFSGIIDFYYACDDVLLYDLAVAANDWCCQGDYRLDKDKVTALLSHYHPYRPLQAHEQNYWPILLRAAALRFWLSRLYDKYFPRPGELVHTKNPDVFKTILSDRIHRQSDYASFWI